MPEVEIFPPESMYKVPETLFAVLAKTSELPKDKVDETLTVLEKIRAPEKISEIRTDNKRRNTRSFYLFSGIHIYRAGKN